MTFQNHVTQTRARTTYSNLVYAITIHCDLGQGSAIVSILVMVTLSFKNCARPNGVDVLRRIQGGSICGWNIGRVATTIVMSKRNGYGATWEVLAMVRSLSHSRGVHGEYADARKRRPEAALAVFLELQIDIVIRVTYMAHSHGESG